MSADSIYQSVKAEIGKINNAAVNISSSVAGCLEDFELKGVWEGTQSEAYMVKIQNIIRLLKECSTNIENEVPRLYEIAKSEYEKNKREEELKALREAQNQEV